MKSRIDGNWNVNGGDLVLKKTGRLTKLSAAI
jgi:hypothetical protein